MIHRLVNKYKSHWCNVVTGKGDGMQGPIVGRVKCRKQSEQAALSSVLHDGREVGLEKAI